MADVLIAGSLNNLPAADRVFYAVGFDRAAGVPMRTVYVDGLRNVLDRLAGRIDRLVYASSAGVYGQSDGEWVDEDSPTEPRHDTGRVCLNAEAAARGVGAVVLRFSGLYGPGRIPRRASVLKGDPIAGDPGKYLNLIQIDDAAGATAAALDRGAVGRTYLVTDDRPGSGRVLRPVAGVLEAPAPRFVAPADGSPESRREEANKRLSNRRMRSELGVRLQYPDITTGVPAALAGS